MARLEGVSKRLDGMTDGSHNETRTAATEAEAEAEAKSKSKSERARERETKVSSKVTNLYACPSLWEVNNKSSLSFCCTA